MARRTTKIASKLKALMYDNVLRITMDGGQIEMIVTNKESGNSFLVKEKNWTEVMREAQRDAKIHSPDGRFNFGNYILIYPKVINNN